MLRKTLIPILSLGILAAGCGSNEAKKDTGALDTAKMGAEMKLAEQGRKLLYATPSPVEAAALLKSSGAKFDPSNLNPVKNVSKYTTATARALNLGVYSTDLVYSNIFGQTQESAEYFRSANTLGSSLGIKDAFGENIFKRVKANIENKDSLMAIIAEASMDADAYFKENERVDASALVALGGWIEGLYISSKIAEKSKDQVLLNRIADQKHALGTLIALTDGITLDKETLPIQTQLKALKVNFDALQLQSDGAKPAAAKDKDGATTIGEKKHLVMTPEQFKDISEKAYQLRNSIVK